MPKRKQIPRRLIRLLLMSPDINRETKAKVMRHRGRNFRKWTGLPKPKNKSDFTPLDTVTEASLATQGKTVNPTQLHRKFRIKDRKAVIEYLKTRQST